MAIELKIPEAGESITAVQIGRWLKSEGDFVQHEEPLVEVETDKASMELPSPASGRLTKVLKKTGDGARVGEVIAVIDETASVEVGGRHTAAAPAVPPARSEAARPGPATETAVTPASAPATERGTAVPAGTPAHVMPAARRVLAERGMQATEVEATGPGGRLLKEDVERHIARPPQ